MGPDIYSKLNFGRKWQQSAHLVEEWSSISRPTGQLCQQEASSAILNLQIQGGLSSTSYYSLPFHNLQINFVNKRYQLVEVR